MCGTLGLAFGLGLIAVGFDGMHRRSGAAACVAGALPIVGLALSAASVVALCVPGFFRG